MGNNGCLPGVFDKLKWCDRSAIVYLILNFVSRTCLLTGKKTHEIKRVIEHRITILMFNHIVILQRILKSFIKSKFDSTRFFPVFCHVRVGVVS